METIWFTVKEVMPNVWGIGEFEHFEEVISYLWVGKRDALLFDTGLGIGDIKAEVEKITDLPVRVINSHSHFDHVGGNSQFGTNLSLQGGETLTIDPFVFTCISTPGHTPESLCLLEITTKTLLSGDTLYPGPIYLHFPESDPQLYKNSIARLNGLELRNILPAHNAFIMPVEQLHLLHKRLDAIGSFEGLGKQVAVDGRLSLLLKE